MPFMASMPDGGGAPAGGGPVTMKVAPDQVLGLKAKLETVRDDVQGFVLDHRDSLHAIPMAQDEVSRDAAQDFSNNADMALDVTRQFLDELNRTIDGLDQAVKTYNLVEDVNTSAMQQQNRGV
ncbi:MAG TPA: PE domain-containing protein [Glaciihabitans sp.]|jgi:methyl-accepting chemotaxis protein|nr:PE domain-containing protein [Glaciihabitans sp.]